MFWNIADLYSPWWLQRQGRFEDAEKALKQLASSKVDVKPTLAIIIETDRLEREIETGSTYLDCFKKINLRRTEIAVGVYTIQVLSGIYLVGYATYFFTRESCISLTINASHTEKIQSPDCRLTKRSIWAWDSWLWDSSEPAVPGFCWSISDGVQSTTTASQRLLSSNSLSASSTAHPTMTTDLRLHGPRQSSW